jgi:NAD(P)-dependent dehydrogenase (short-subunit alcohol dehydrogenase family)
MWKYVIGTVAVLPLLRHYFNGPVCKIKRDLSSKIAIVTGANTGIGKETACLLAEMGATIILACRSKARTQELLNELQGKCEESKIFFFQLDLSDLQSVREFVAIVSTRFNRLDFLINNAGLLSN